MVEIYISTVEDYREEDNIISWRYPRKQLRVRLITEKDYLNVEITSETEGDNTVCWPYIGAEQYYLPLGEGKRIPAGEPVWIQHLAGQQLGVLEQLSMPFWISSDGEHCVLFIMEDPGIKHAVTVFMLRKMTRSWARKYIGIMWLKKID